MRDEVPPFALDDAPEQVREEAAMPTTTWQIDLLWKALDARGVAEIAERQQGIGDYAGRPVASLRELSGAEVLRILSKLGEQPSAGETTGSAWNQWNEDTWIDRL
jgi:hypothetical protein